MIGVLLTGLIISTPPSIMAPTPPTVLPKQAFNYGDICIAPELSGSKIDDRFVVNVKSLIYAGAECIVITSAGGGSIQAADIVNYGNAHGITFYFTGVCASACGIIALQAERAIFSVGSSLILHPFINTRYEVISNALARNEQNIIHVEERHFRYESYALDIMTDDEFAYVAKAIFGHMKPICVKSDMPDGSRYSHAAIKSYYQYVVPSDRKLQEWRVNREYTLISEGRQDNMRLVDGMYLIEDDTSKTGVGTVEIDVCQ